MSSVARGSGAQVAASAVRATRIARYTRSGVMGSSVIRTPVASFTAFATAAEIGIVPASPSPFAPKGPA